MSRLVEFRALERLLATSPKNEFSFVKVDLRLLREFEFESKPHNPLKLLTVRKLLP